jgi:hypothetical protein
LIIERSEPLMFSFDESEQESGMRVCANSCTGRERRQMVGSPNANSRVAERKMRPESQYGVGSLEAASVRLKVPSTQRH